jgi:hypothetical protein
MGADRPAIDARQQRERRCSGSPRVKSSDDCGGSGQLLVSSNTRRISDGSMLARRKSWLASASSTSTIPSSRPAGSMAARWRRSTSRRACSRGPFHPGRDCHPAGEQRHATSAWTPPGLPGLAHRCAETVDGIVPERPPDCRPHLVEVDAECLQQVRVTGWRPAEEAFEGGGHVVGVAGQQRRDRVGE